MNETTEPHNGDRSRRKYVFVGGSPRSGTSLLGRNIARMEDCTGLKNTGVFGDEGSSRMFILPPLPTVAQADVVSTRGCTAQRPQIC